MRFPTPMNDGVLRPAAGVPRGGEALQPPAPVLASTAPAMLPVRSRPARRWPAFAAGLLLGGLIGGLLVSNVYDARSLGERLDASVNALQRSGDEVAAASLSQVDRVGVALDDSAISARVRTALAADPGLSALKIEVSTEQGVVTLDGPAPDAAARDRASVLAQAPDGVRGVRNRLRLPAPEPS